MRIEHEIYLINHNMKSTSSSILDNHGRNEFIFRQSDAIFSNDNCTRQTAKFNLDYDPFAEDTNEMEKEIIDQNIQNYVVGNRFSFGDRQIIEEGPPPENQNNSSWIKNVFDGMMCCHFRANSNSN